MVWVNKHDLTKTTEIIPFNFVIFNLTYFNNTFLATNIWFKNHIIEFIRLQKFFDVVCISIIRHMSVNSTEISTPDGQVKYFIRFRSMSKLIYIHSQKCWVDHLSLIFKKLKSNNEYRLKHKMNGACCST